MSHFRHLISWLDVYCRYWCIQFWYSFIFMLAVGCLQQCRVVCRRWRKCSAVSYAWKSCEMLGFVLTVPSSAATPAFTYSFTMLILTTVHWFDICHWSLLLRYSYFAINFHYLITERYIFHVNLSLPYCVLIFFFIYYGPMHDSRMAPKFFICYYHHPAVSTSDPTSVINCYFYVSLVKTVGFSWSPNWLVPKHLRLCISILFFKLNPHIHLVRLIFVLFNFISCCSSFVMHVTFMNVHCLYWSVYIAVIESPSYLL